MRRDGTVVAMVGGTTTGTTISTTTTFLTVKFNQILMWGDYFFFYLKMTSF